MFCPFCGDELSQQTDELYCGLGDMSLSKIMEQVLISRYGDTPPTERPNFTPHYEGGLNWFCPGCGISLDEDLSCSQCGQSLKNLM